MSADDELFAAEAAPFPDPSNALLDANYWAQLDTSAGLIFASRGMSRGAPRSQRNRGRSVELRAVENNYGDWILLPPGFSAAAGQRLLVCLLSIYCKRGPTTKAARANVPSAKSDSLTFPPTLEFFIKTLVVLLKFSIQVALYDFVSNFQVFVLEKVRVSSKMGWNRGWNLIRFSVSRSCIHL